MDRSWTVKICGLCGEILVCIGDLKIPLCAGCRLELEDEPALRRLIDVAFEAGRRAVIGDTSDVDDEGR